MNEYTVVTEDITDNDYIALRGRPANGVKSIGAQSGFVQCENASVSCSGSALEIAEINAFLNSGFYYE